MTSSRALSISDRLLEAERLGLGVSSLEADGLDRRNDIGRDGLEPDPGAGLVVSSQSAAMPWPTA